MSFEPIKQRLFFALWPDAKTRKTIAKLVQRVIPHHQGKPVRTDNLHLTLAFLGNVNKAQRDCVETVAESLSITPFSLCLEHLGVFPRAKVLWLGIKEQPDALIQLANDLAKGARDCGIKLDETAFEPHVSLMRKTNQLHELEVEPIYWNINQFCLVQSISHVEGVEYQVVKSW